MKTKNKIYTAEISVAILAGVLFYTVGLNPGMSGWGAVFGVSAITALLSLLWTYVTYGVRKSLLASFTIASTILSIGSGASLVAFQNEPVIFSIGMLWPVFFSFTLSGILILLFRK